MSDQQPLSTYNMQDTSYQQEWLPHWLDDAGSAPGDDDLTAWANWMDFVQDLGVDPGIIDSDNVHTQSYDG